MKTKFYLRKGTQKQSINFEFRNGVKTKFRASTGFVLRNEKEWDSAKQRIKIPSSTPNASLINAKLSELNSQIDKLFYEFGNGAVTLDNISCAFDTVFGTSKATSNSKNTYFLEDSMVSETNNDFIAYYNWVLDFYSKNSSPFGKKILTSGTIKTMKNSLSLLNRYVEYKKLKTLYFDDIKRSFYYDFLSYLNGKNYSLNYIGTIIQKIKTVMSYAYEDNRHSNLEYKKKYFAKLSEEINHPFLHKDELEVIDKLEIKIPELEITRDIFLIACNTGLRISDLLYFLKNPKILQNKNFQFIEVEQMKTGNIVIIPINIIIRKITEKYNGFFPPYQSSHIVNENLKSICKMAKIDDLHEFKRTEGGVKKTHSIPKYKLISSHTGRRSFCTNTYIDGMSAQDIMAISGHCSEKQLKTYIKVDKLDNATRIADNPFFK